jgi:hypothetical protein
MTPAFPSPPTRMASQLLRRLSKVQLLQALRRQTAAPFHVIMWDNSPVRLAEALTRVEHAPDDAVYYATPQRVFSTSAPAPAGR